MDALSTNSCMLNGPFIGYYQCVITSSTGRECQGWSCGEIGASIGVISDGDDDPAEAGSGELTGITSDSLTATSTPTTSSEDAVGSGTGVAVSGQRSASAGKLGSVAGSFGAAVVAGYTVTAALVG